MFDVSRVRRAGRFTAGTCEYRVHMTGSIDMVRRNAKLASAVVVVALGALGADAQVRAQTIDPRAELVAIASHLRIAKPTPPPRGSCTSPSAAEARAIERRVLAWIDHELPDERPTPVSEGNELVIGAACKTKDGVFLDVAQDRESRKTHGGGDRRNFILRITADRIDALAAKRTTPVRNWQEWADEGALNFIAQVDVDGDGKDDLLWSDFEHEGGSTVHYDALTVMPAAGPRAEQHVVAVTVNGLAEVRASAGQVVIAAQPRDSERWIHSCLDHDLRLTRCPAARTAQLAHERARFVDEIAHGAEVPDRDRAARWLAQLGVTPAPGLLRALPELPALERATRDVDELLEAPGLSSTFSNVFSSAHLEADATFDKFMAAQGDTRCTPTAPDDATRARLTAWLATAEKQPEDVVVVAECAPYAWIGWHRKGDTEAKQLLVDISQAEPIRVTTLHQQDVAESARMTTAVGYVGHFFKHGDVTIGVVIHDRNLAVIANDKIVAQSHGEITLYGYHPAWAETAPDLIIDSGTVFHPTPTGLEKVDRAVLRDVMRKRNALQLVAGPEAPSHDPAYLDALKELGAGPALIAECRALP